MATPRLIMKMRVADIRQEAGEVAVVEFRHPRRPELPAFEAGSHVDLHLPGGKVRQYSLLGDPADRARYLVGIKREVGGRGGSDWLHGNLALNSEFPVSAPRNHFRLAPEATSHFLLAGGIGITPMISMARVLLATGAPFELHYFARGRTLAPLVGDLEATLPPSALRLHFDDEPATRADLAALLRDPREGQHLYYCGPPGFMAAVREASSGWQRGTVHFEAFQPDVDETFVPEAFTVKLHSSGRELPVPPDVSALEVLRTAGVPLLSSCENGVCGSCECGYLSGDPIHRDAVLSEEAKAQRYMPCVSRARGVLVLDL